MAQAPEVWVRVVDGQRVVEVRKLEEAPAGADWWRLINYRPGGVIPVAGAHLEADEEVQEIQGRLYAVRGVTWTSTGGARRYDRGLSQWRELEVK